MFAFYVCVFATCVSSTLVSTTTVHTEYGSVWSNAHLITKRGTKFLAFRGIPYAAPPLGHLRFEPPQKPEKWSEPRNASAYGAICNQPRHPFFDSREEIRSEDCLFINVYTSDIQPKKLRPVLVYVHGGAFHQGSGNGFQPDYFMDDPPTVMVTFNYRLGVFGFLSSGDEMLPGNYALKDQLAALKWVQRNIGNFGGDPKNVTLMGQSSGAHNVHAHTLSHASEGLFHRAVILSGNTLALWGYYPPQSHEAQHTFNLLLELTNCKRHSVEANIECLRKLDPNVLEEAEHYFLANQSIPFVFRMVIEPTKVHNAFITTDPHELKYPNPKIPIIVGVCSAEGMMNAGMFLRAHAGQGELSRALDEALPFSLHYKYWLKQNQIPSFTERLKNFFFENPHSITPFDFPSLNKLFGKMNFQMPTVDMVMSYPGKVYTYFYDYMAERNPAEENMHHGNMGPMNNFLGAGHGDDLFSIFGPRERHTPTATDQRISDQLVTYLKNFIRTGNPNSNTSNLPKWNAVYSKKVEYLQIDVDGFTPKTGLAEDPAYAFYRSLLIPWHKMSSNGGTKIPKHDKSRLAKHRRPKSEHKTHEPYHNRFNSTMDFIMYLWRFV